MTKASWPRRSRCTYGALAGYEKALGPDHTLSLSTVNNLGTMYRDQGKLAEAEEMYSRALARCEKALGPDHTLTLATVYNLGTLYCDQGKLAEAEEMYQRALMEFRKSLGSEHPLSVIVMSNLKQLDLGGGTVENTSHVNKKPVSGALDGVILGDSKL